ncbi:hypothetical protein HHI36_002256 [Cryptolaemus montrouzieri]|uniref:Uncharacterized protein n=1 Tax=Cryptolaemus montrouzieri TaxID=559131 RepID=A0ABD2P9Z0_9CUCU
MVFGRCLGAAKRLKVVMPIILVKLGVIITMLAFLTLFSLKTLGLVIFLSFLGTSGITKIGAVPGSRQHDTTTHQSHPQNVHLHIQPNKDNRHSSLLGESYLIDRDTDSLLSDKLAWYQQYINSNNYLNTDISA